MKPCNELEIVGLDATYRKYYLKGYEDAEKEHNYHLKKIRAEIEETCMNITYQENNGKKETLGLRKALDIIDKYITESEDKG